eukprot:TRINITY_DN6624_c0_g1_i1.p1 TRINITY_DN6624_c0_g1~~TRINITY_DN6624_c0_g1_i1.p1  ORF type:complete len:115 (+),score=1.36 TRINITY_DN6624_c0_g1_i1:34-378(+)
MFFGVWKDTDTNDEYTLVAPPEKGAWILPQGLSVRAVTWSTQDEEDAPRRTLLLGTNSESTDMHIVNLSEVKVLRADDKDSLEYVFTLNRDGTITLTKTPLEGPETTVTLQKAS